MEGVSIYSILGGTTRYTHTRPKLPDQLYTQLQVHDTNIPEPVFDTSISDPSMPVQRMPDTNMPDPRDTTQVYPPTVLRT